MSFNFIKLNHHCLPKGIFDCLTGPCVTVPGVGKLQGSNRPTQFTGRDVYSFFGIPFGESTAGEGRFAPPRPKGPLNDGKVISTHIKDNFQS